MVRDQYIKEGLKCPFMLNSPLRSHYTIIKIEYCYFVSDFVTPLKKRRMARESVDGPQSAGPSTSSPLLAPMVSQFGESEGQPTEVVQEENKPFFPNYTPSVKVIAVCLIY